AYLQARVCGGHGENHAQEQSPAHRARGEFGQCGGGGNQRIVGRAGGKRLGGGFRGGGSRGGVGEQRGGIGCYSSGKVVLPARLAKTNSSERMRLTLPR